MERNHLSELQAIASQMPLGKSAHADLVLDNERSNIYAQMQPYNN